MLCVMLFDYNLDADTVFINFETGVKFVWK